MSIQRKIQCVVLLCLIVTSARCAEQKAELNPSGHSQDGKYQPHKDYARHAAVFQNELDELGDDHEWAGVYAGASRILGSHQDQAFFLATADVWAIS